MFKELFRNKEEKSDANELLNFADNVDKIPDPFVVTEAAAKKITSLIKEEPKATGLRIFVQGGGCSGFQYGFTFAEEDYKDDLQGSSFVIRNPNATSTCGCGSSFAAG